jgi:hypothetical protein
MHTRTSLQNLEELALRKLGDEAELVRRLKRIEQQDDVWVVEPPLDVDFLRAGGGMSLGHCSAECTGMCAHVCARARGAQRDPRTRTAGARPCDARRRAGEGGNSRGHADTRTWRRLRMSLSDLPCLLMSLSATICDV